MNRLLKLLAAATLGVALVACGTPTTPTTPPTDPSVTGVVVTPSEAEVEVGSTVTLSATVQGDEGVSQAVTWSSSHTSVATVTQQGVVTGVAEGTATVTATSQADTTFSGQAAITVLAEDEPPVTVDCSQAQALSENITVDTTLPLDCHRVTTNITISAALTILPGTVLEFESGAGLRVSDGGSLRAEGTVTNPITFTSASGDRNDWRGVGIFTSSANNVLAYVTIEKAGLRNTTINSFNSTNLYVDENARVAITHSTFAEAGGGGNGVGIYVDHPSSELVTFADNTFDGNAEAAMRITTQQLGQIGEGNVFGLNALPGAEHIQVAATTIRSSATWPAADVAYRFFGNHFIDDPGAIVTIEAGAKLEFASDAGLRVNSGALQALGTSEAGITFTSASGNPEDWRGVGIASNSEQNRLEHVTIEKAGIRNTAINNFNRANLYLHDNARVAITHSTFAEAGGGGNGIYINVPSVVLTAFDDNEFVNNSGAPIRIYSSQLGQIGSGNVFGTDAPFAGRFVQVEATTITTSQTWQNLDLPYRFFGNHFIEDPDATVTIEPGTTLQFDNAGLRVSAGSLVAVGTASERITFTSASGNPDGWRGVAVSSSSTENRIQHATLANAGARNTALNGFNGGNLVVLSGGVVAVTDSAFNNSSRAGIYTRGTITDQTGTTIDPLTQGNNSFSGNDGPDVDDGS